MKLDPRTKRTLIIIAIIGIFGLIIGSILFGWFSPNKPQPAETATLPAPTITAETLSPPPPASTELPTLTPDATVQASPIAATESLPASAAVFPIGPGGSDVIPHQIIRTNTDNVYIFVNQQSSNLLRVYRTVNAGFPNSGADFAAPIELEESSEPISVDAVYDGANIIHVLVNTLSGEIKDHPFDLTTNTFKSSVSLASDGGTVGSGLYVGTSGVAGMMDTSGNLHIVYWTNGDHILHRAYTYDSIGNTLTPAADFTQVDSNGNANHPAIAVSPFDNSVTIAWVSQANSPPQILSRTHAANGTWSGVETASTAPVWTSPDNGLNIDQGPSLIIDTNGIRHLTYIEEIDFSVGDYGRIHYATNSGAGWSDMRLNAFSHDPALSINSAGTIRIIGHGHPLNPACQSMDEMCTITLSNGNWENPVLFASPPQSFSFDSSPSVKWSVVGFNRPEVVEFIFFMTPYHEPTIFYGRIP